MRWGPAIVAGIIATIVVAVLLVTPALSGWGLVYHSGCARGKLVESENLLTPVAILNSPYNSSSTAVAVRLTEAGGAPVPDLGGQIAASNGSTVALFSLNEWSIYSQASTWVLGPGGPSSCTSDRVAILDPAPFLLPDGRMQVTVTLQGPGSEADLDLPSQISSFGLDSVLFGANLLSNDSGGIGTCGAAQSPVYVGVTQISVYVPASNPGGGDVAAIIPDVVAYAYGTFPQGGNWLTDDTPSAGWAFSYYPCS